LLFLSLPLQPPVIVLWRLLYHEKILICYHIVIENE
jgi:hypothetical protein